MTARLTSFDELKVGNTKYLFIFGSWMEESENPKRSALRKRLSDAVTEFGDKLENKGWTAQSIPKYELENARRLLEKPWPDDVTRLLNGTLWSRGNALPYFLLVIDRDFNEFDPQIHNAAIMWLRYSEQDLPEFQHICNELARRVRLGQDLFRYFRSEFDRLPPNERGRFPGTWEEQKQAEESLNFEVETHKKFLSFDLARLANQTQKSAPRVLIDKMRRFVDVPKRWIAVVWKDQVASKVIAQAIIVVLGAAVVALAGSLGWRLLW